jgi:hypothetical protein
MMMPTDFAKAREAAAAKLSQELQTILNGAVKREQGSFSVAPLVDAALSAFEEAAFVLVPKEPTPKMLDAAAKAMSPEHRPTQRRVSVKRKHAIRYNAMIAAAIAERQK